MATTKTKQGGFAHIVIVLVLAIVLAVIGAFTVYQIKHAQKVSTERKLYASAENDVQTYVDTIASRFQGEKKNESYCGYSSAKYSKGSLSCTVGAELTIQLDDKDKAAVLDLANYTQNTLPWKFTFDNTDPTLPGSENVIKSRVYKKGVLTCGVHYYYKWTDINSREYDESVVLIRTSCSGSALSEYY